MMDKSRKVLITTDCVCDLSEAVLWELEVEEVHYSILAGGYEYRSEREITSKNVLDYVASRNQFPRAEAPSKEEYAGFFNKHLKKGLPILHLATGSKLGRCYENAVEAAKHCDRVFVYDTEQFSGGLGILVLHAAKLAKEGKTLEEISIEIQKLQKQINTSFLVAESDSLYRAHRIKKWVNKMCDVFSLHLMFRIVYGEQKIAFLRVGKLEECYKRYIKAVLKKANPQKDLLILSVSGCSYENREMILAEISKYAEFEHIMVNTVSAAVACNCGPQSIGLQFLDSESEQLQKNEVPKTP